MNVYKGTRNPQTGECVVKVNDTPIKSFFPKLNCDWTVQEGQCALAYAILFLEFNHKTAWDAKDTFRYQIICRVPTNEFALTSKQIQDWYQDYRRFCEKWDMEFILNQEKLHKLVA